MARLSEGGGPTSKGSLGDALGGFARQASSISRSSTRAAPKKRKTSSGSSGTQNRTINARSSGSNNTGYRAPTPPRVVAPRPPVGNSLTGAIAPSSPPPTAAPLTLDQWLANDTTYKSQADAYQKALADYGTQFTGEQTKYNNEYGSSINKLNTEKTQGAESLADDFSSRGLITSGVYADALNDFQNNYQTKQADLERAKAAYMADLNTGKTNFTTQQDLALQKAKQDAANRRTMQLGI